MLLLSLVILVPVRYQSLDVPLDFTERAAPVARILAKLSEVTKTKLETAPSVASDIVVVRANGMTANELMKRIATVTACEWKAEGSGFRLIPSVEARRKELEDEQATKISGFRQTLEKSLKEIADAEKKSKSKDDAVNFAMAAMLPANGPVLQLINALDYRPIALLEPGERIVYSTSPNRMQRPLGSNAAKVIGELKRKHNATAAISTDERPDTPPGLEMLPEAFKNQIANSTKPIGEVSKALLVVSNISYGAFSMTQADLKLYGPDGKMAHKVTASITGNQMDFMAMIANKPELPPVGSHTPFTPSDDTKEVLQAGRANSIEVGKVLKPRAYELMARPDLRDPLSFLDTDVLFAIAKKRKQSLVACIPDDVFHHGGSPQLTVEQYETQLAKEKIVVELPDSKCWMVKPANPASTRRHRVDRVGLAGLLKAAQEKGLPSLDDVAAFAVTSENPVYTPFSTTYCSLLAPGTIGLMDPFNWDAIRLYGMIDPTLRKQLIEGGQLSFSALPPDVANQAMRMIYGTGARLEIDGTKKDSNPLDFLSRAMQMESEADYRTEPTEILPNGLPANGYISLASAKEPIAVVVSEDGKAAVGQTGLLDLNMMALFRIFKEDPKFAAMGSPMPSLNKVKIGQRNAITLHMQLAEKVSANAVLNDNQVSKDAVVVKSTSLPDDFQKLLNDRVEAIKKSPFGAIIAFGLAQGAKTPPPY